MGMLENLMGMAGGGGTSEQGGFHPGLVQHVLGMLGNQQGGGLGGLLQQLQGGGLGDAAASWVGNGPNQAVSGDQIHQALGSGQIQQLAEKFGLPSSMVSSQLAQILPQIVNHLTPGGSVPQHGMLDSALGMLKSKLFG